MIMRRSPVSKSLGNSRLRKLEALSCRGSGQDLQARAGGGGSGVTGGGVGLCGCGLQESGMRLRR